LKSWESNENLLMKPLGEGQSINIPMPRIQVSQMGQGLPVGTSLGELVEKRDLNGLHRSLNDSVGGDGKPRRRSITEGTT
jgi:hypothetical protein